MAHDEGGTGASDGLNLALGDVVMPLPHNLPREASMTTRIGSSWAETPNVQE